MKLFNTFPREIGIPQRKIVQDKSEWDKNVNKYNGIKTVFTSLYALVDDNKDIVIDKIFFDLDSDMSFKNVIKLHNYCVKNNLRHSMYFSGGGFHMYLFTKNGDKLINPKRALFNSHHSVCKKLSFTIGDPKTHDVDVHIIGDVRRLSRVPGTWNLKHQKYCTPLAENDLKLGLQHIKTLAQKQHHKHFVYGTELFDIQKFDDDSFDFKKKYEIDTKLEDIKLNDEYDKNMLPCIKAWFHKERTGWTLRGFIIMFLRDFGIWRTEINKPMPCMYSEVVKIFKENVSEDEFAHMTSAADSFQIISLFKNLDNSFPTCDTLKQYCFCPLEIQEYCKERDLY